MQGGWNGGSSRGRNNGSRDRNYPGETRSRESAQHNAGDRWSDELDAIFERAPKNTTAPKNNDEQNFFEERTEVKPHALTCPHCQRTQDYPLTWLVRRKREQPAGYVDEPTAARFEKARSYMVRREDSVACTSCRKRFEIAGVQTVAFLEHAAKGSVEDRAARVRAAFAGRPRA